MSKAEISTKPMNERKMNESKTELNERKNDFLHLT